MHHAAGYISYIFTDNSVIMYTLRLQPVLSSLYNVMLFRRSSKRLCATRVECQTRAEVVQSVARKFKNVIRAIKRTAHQVFTPRTHIQQQHKRNPPLNDYKNILLLCTIYYNRHLYHVGRGRKPCTGIRWRRAVEWRVGDDGGVGALRLRSVSEEKYILIYTRIIYVRRARIF